MSLAAWLRGRLLLILGFIAMLGLSALVLALSGQALAPYGYASLLCAVALLIWLAADWLRCLRRHQALLRLLEGLPDSLSHLPEPTGPLERDYQDLLRALGQRLRGQITQDDTRYQALMHYHALWNHQIKTPIAAMRLLLARTDSEDNRLLLSELFKVEQYVEMALNHLRLDDKASDFVFEKVSLLAVATQAARKYAGQFVLKRLSLRIDIPEEASAVTDAKWLGFVIEQLLSNAVKYTQQGGVSVRWQAEGRALCIQDSGRGISPEDLPRVFDLGYTGYSGRVFEQSTGIGLYLCRQICQRLGIGLTLSAAPAQGTLATLSLPEDDLQIE